MTDKALIYVVLQTVIKSCEMALMQPNTLYLYLPQGVGIKTRTIHQTRAINAPQTQCTASAKTAYPERASCNKMPIFAS